MIATARVTVVEPIPEGKLVILYSVDRTSARPRSRRNPRHPRGDAFATWEPAWPWQVEPELALLLAFVDIVEAHSGDPATMEALYASALRRLEAREQGLLTAADRRRDGQPVYAMTDEVRALFGRPDPIRALIGGSEDEHWKPGLAMLTPSEREALWLHLHGLSRAAIALAMAPARTKRFGREGALPLATVSKYLWRARVKLRTNVFALPVESEEAYLVALDAEEERAERERRAVDPAAAAALDIERTRRLHAWPARWEELEPVAEDAEPWLDDVDHDPRETP